MDTRDGRRYEIRKYADGQCWMADDLKYGGTTASTAGTAFANTNNYCTQQAPTAAQGNYANINAAWYEVENGLSTGKQLRGMCYNPGPTNEANNTAIGWSGASVETGYLYTWGAATQDDYTTGAIGARKVRGICPAGWHLPVEGEAFTNANVSGNDAGCTAISCVVANASDFANLDKIYGGTGANEQTSVTHAREYFWGIPTGSSAALSVGWKGVYPGCSGNAACVTSARGAYGQWWSSGAALPAAAYYLDVYSGLIHLAVTNTRGFGLQIRCIKN
jgi:uncharacterized protein (TIGR02145 family)